MCGTSAWIEPGTVELCSREVGEIQLDWLARWKIDQRVAASTVACCTYVVAPDTYLGDDQRLIGDAAEEWA